MFKKKGFTLVELIISITILGIIISIGSVSYFSHLKGVRDANRISQLEVFKGILDTHRIRNELPLPEDSIEIKDGSGNILAYQGDIGEQVMGIIGHSGEGKDPLDSSNYVYEVTSDRKHYQLLAFLEEPSEIGSDVFTINNDNRFPYILGEKLGILTTSTGLPVHKDSSIKSAGEIDITSSVDDSIISFVVQSEGIKQGYTDLIGVLSRGGEAYGVESGVIVDYLNEENGTCGTDNGISLIITPVNLCNVGIPTTVIDSGIGSTYNWTCKGTETTTNVSCSANHILGPINGLCGVDNTGNFLVTPTNLCTTGASSSVTDNGEGNTYDWTCAGQYGGAQATCNANHIFSPINGLCGVDNTGDFLVTPTNLCTTGVGSAVIDNGEGNTYDWTCDGQYGGIQVTCNANHLFSPINGLCGTDHLQNAFSTPTNLCTTGASSSVTDNGEGSTYNWTCDGQYSGTQASCNANHLGAGDMELIYSGVVNGDVIELPFNGTVNITNIDWGNGGESCPTTSNGYVSCTYSNPTVGDHNIKVYGSATGFGKSGASGIGKLISVNKWDGLGLSSLYRAFYNAINLVTVPNYLPVGITAISNMFEGASSFNQSLASWDTSNVTYMNGMFYGASSFNQSLASWDTSNVTYMNGMFYGASLFNQPLNHFDTSNVTNMNDMFRNAISFNQPLTSWNTSNVNNMFGMFYIASSFNQPLNHFDTSNVTMMGSMFGGASLFNQDISGWDTSKVTYMRYMFGGASLFNQDISGWDTSYVINMENMFKNTNIFNQDLTCWDVTNIVSEPSDFATSSALQVGNKPLWGTAGACGLVNGVCGSDNGANLSFLPTNLCTTGTSSSVTDNGIGNTYTWSCLGSYGGTDITSCNANHICTTITDDFESNTIGTWTEITGTANVSWQTDSGTTPSGSTGPGGASSGIYYIYTEASSPNYSNKTFIIENDLTCQNAINFDYHAYGASMGNLEVQEFDGVIWSTINTISGQQDFGYSDPWNNTGNIFFTPGTTKVRLHYTSGNNYTGDFSIDKITLLSANSCEVNPGYSNTDYVVGNPNIDGTAWQNTSSGNACYYECTGGYTGNDCSVPPVVNGVCGSDHGQNSYLTPVNLCLSGTLNSFVDNGLGSTYNWNCNGSGGGVSVSCNSNHIIPPVDMQLTYDITTGDKITLGYYGTVNIEHVDWGDGGVNGCPTTSNGNITCDYDFSSNGLYSIKVTGSSTGYSGGGNGNVKSGYRDLQSIDKWDGIGLINLYNAFYLNSDLVSVPSTLPSTVTNIEGMFRGTTLFNGDISGWDTANVTNMNSMFRSANSFNGDISLWDTSNVNDMFQMFFNAVSFNGNIGLWITTNVTDMGSMFKGASMFNQNIGSWNTSNVTNMSEMFRGAVSFNGNIGSWITTNVTDMGSMFRGASVFNQSVSSFNTSNITDMSFMFEGASSFNQSVSNFITTNVLRMNSMFRGASSFNQSISNFNTTNVYEMGGMFKGASSFNQSISNFVTTNVTNMKSMFDGASSFNQSVSNFVTTNVTNMGSMFRGASSFNQVLNTFDTTNTISMYNMFKSASSFNQNLTGWNVNSLEDIPIEFSSGSPLSVSNKPTWVNILAGGLDLSTCSASASVEVIYESTLSGDPSGLTCDHDIAICDGLGSGLIIAACNVGSNTVGTGSLSYGDYFQWGNNNPFNTGFSAINEKVNIAPYDYISPYNDSTLRIVKNTTWGIFHEYDLWGHTTNTKESRQGVCKDGYHVAQWGVGQNKGWDGLMDIGNGTIWGSGGTNIMNYLMIPMSGYLSNSTGGKTGLGVYGYYHTSQRGGRKVRFQTGGRFLSSSNDEASSYPIRCFKNTSGTYD